jgi:hypothetical protein
MPPLEKKRVWEDKLTHSAFFLGALLFHLVIFLIVAAWIIFPQAPPQPDGPRISSPRVAENLPHKPEVLPKPPELDASANANAQVPTVTRTFSESDFKIPISSIGVTGPQTIIEPTPPKKVLGNHGMSDDRRVKILRGVLLYRTPGQIADHDPSATFPVYVAAYAKGDWACNIRLDSSGNIVGGSIPDLAAKISEWSHGHVNAQVVPKPLDIGSPDLLNKMPPFIFFTGHKDFVLTDQEIGNLQAYLENGGLIWGDNALPGHGSRFDVAFRREMKRVVPDIDKDFEPVTMDADVFTKSKFAISQVPQGMNYYSEPIEHLDIDGKFAILYTPNDYSDLYAMRVLPGDTQIAPTSNSRRYTSPLITSGSLLSNNNIYFRNFTLESALAVHRLGMNIVIHLLTRFDDELILAH